MEAGKKSSANGTILIAAQAALSLAAGMAALAVPLSFGSSEAKGAIRDGMLVVSLAIGIAATAVAFHLALLKLREITGRRVMSSFSSLVVGYVPIALSFWLLGIVLTERLHIVKLPDDVGASLGGITYLGWIFASLAWPILWMRILGVQSSGSSHTSGIAKLVVWAAYFASAAAFVGRASHIPENIQVASSVLQVASLVVGKQLMQELEGVQARVASANAISLDTPHRTLIVVPRFALWLILAASAGLIGILVAEDLPILKRFLSQ